jgi:hypothetical protein
MRTNFCRITFVTNVALIKDPNIFFIYQLPKSSVRKGIQYYSTALANLHNIYTYNVFVKHHTVKKFYSGHTCQLTRYQRVTPGNCITGTCFIQKEEGAYIF